MAGKARAVAGELGVHQFSGPKGDQDLESAQYTVSHILDILGNFDVPPAVISRMLKTAPDDMYVFSAKEVEDLKINRDPHSFDPHIVNLATLPREMLTSPEPDPESRSASPPAELQDEGDEPLFAIYFGLDFYGGDVAKVRTQSFAGCMIECLETKACTGITFNTDAKLKRGPNCFLKDDGVTRHEAYEKAVSATFVWTGNGVITANKQSFRPEFVTENDLKNDR